MDRQQMIEERAKGLYEQYGIEKNLYTKESWSWKSLQTKNDNKSYNLRTRFIRQATADVDWFLAQANFNQDSLTQVESQTLSAKPSLDEGKLRAILLANEFWTEELHENGDISFVLDVEKIIPEILSLLRPREMKRPENPFVLNNGVTREMTLAERHAFELGVEATIKENEG